MPKKRTSESQNEKVRENDNNDYGEDNEDDEDNQQPSTSTAASSSIINNKVINKSRQNISGGEYVNAFQTFGTANIYTNTPSLAMGACSSTDPAVEQQEGHGGEMEVGSCSYYNSNSDSDSETNSEKSVTRPPPSKKGKLESDSREGNSRGGENLTQSVITHTFAYQPIQTVQAQNCHIVNAIQTVNAPKPPVTSLEGLGNLPNPPAIFTGRVEFLEELEKKLEDVTSKNPQISQISISRLLVIKGCGGIGKSSVAKKYAQTNSTLYNGNIAWINAENRASATESFVRLAQNLEIDRVGPLCKSARNDVQKEDCFESLTSLVNVVYAHLNKHRAEFHNALFILDNAQQLQDARTENGEFLFGMEHCFPTTTFNFLPVFLATSRIINWGRPGDGVPKLDLVHFSPNESLDYLLQVCNNNDWSKRNELENQDVKPLAEILDGFPLALELAAAAISAEWDESTPKSEKRRNIQKYMEDFHEDGRKWASREMPITCSKEYDKILSNVWEGTIRRIRGWGRDGELALRLLKISSFLPTDFISSRLLHFINKKIAITRRSKGDLSLDDEVVQLTLSGLKLLKRFSMIKMDNMINIDEDEGADFFDNTFFYYDNGSGKIYIHRLVQKMERVKFTVPVKVTRGQSQNQGQGQGQSQGQGQGQLVLLPAFPQPPPPHYTETDLNDLSDLLLFIRQNTKFFQGSGRFPQVLHNLKDSKWPGQSYRDYVTLCYSGLDFGAGAFRTGQEEKLFYVKSVYDFLVKQPDKDRDEEFLVMCKLFLIHLNHHDSIFKRYDNLSELKKEFKNILHLEVPMDNSAIFNCGDELIKISLGQFLHWLLDKVRLYIHNPWLQGEAACLYKNLNQKLQPALLQNDGLHDKLFKWFQLHHNEVLNGNLEPNSTNYDYQYQLHFESKERNLQWTSEDLFRLVAPFLTLEQAIGVITQTVNNRKHQLQNVFNCWQYFDYNIKNLPGIPWTLWSQNLGGNKFELTTIAANFKFMTENQLFADQMGEILQNYVKDCSTMKAMRQKEKEAKKTNSNHLYTPECEEGSVERKEHKGKLIYPIYTIDLIRILSYFDGAVKNLIGLNPGLPLALKKAMTCQLDYCTAHMSVSIHLHNVILTWLAVLPHALSSSISVELLPLKDFAMTSEEQRNCKNIFKAEIKTIKRQTREKSFTPSNYEPLSREETRITRERIIDKFKQFACVSPKENCHFYKSWNPVVQHFEELEKELICALTAYEELERRHHELYEQNLNNLEDKDDEEGNALADFINELSCN